MCLMKKVLLVGAGVLCMVLGIIGIVIPILPTTPFVLLAGICFASSSKKLYDKLMNSKYFGAYIKNYKEKCGIPKKVKIISLVFLWTALIVSSVIFRIYYVWIILAVVGVAVTIHILLIKTKKD